MFVARLLLLRWATTELGVQLSLGIEMETYDDQGAAANNQFCCTYRSLASRFYQHNTIVRVT